MNKKNGQSLLELIVAIGVATLLAVSLISTTLLTQKSAKTAKNNTQATKLAQENLEQMRVFRDRKGFDSILTSSTNCYILNTKSFPVVSTDPATWQLNSTDCTSGGEDLVSDNISFNRKLRLTSVNIDKKSVKVTVSWQEGSALKMVENETFLTDWCKGEVSPTCNPP